MAELPPLFVEVDATYEASAIGLPYRDLVIEGSVTGLAVAQRAAGVNLSVDVSPGTCWVKGDSVPLVPVVGGGGSVDSNSQPTYRCRSNSVVNLVITPDASQPRIVRIVAQVRDDDFDSNGNRDWQLQAVHGTAGASPSPPSEPDTALTLALITVPGGTSAVVDADITDERTFGGSSNLFGVPPDIGADIGYQNFTPTGMIALHAGPDAPDGWLLCDGSEISRAEYNNLFAAIDVQFGLGDGSSTFNLPDLRGRVPVGVNPAGEGIIDEIGKSDGDEPEARDGVFHEHGYMALTGSSGPYPADFSNPNGLGSMTDFVGQSPLPSGHIAHLVLNFIIKT